MDCKELLMNYQPHCPNCGTAIPPQNINVQKFVASCINCGTVFNFEQNISGSKPKIKHRKIKQPKYMNVVTTHKQVVIKMPLLTSIIEKSLALIMILFAVSMLIIFSLFYDEALATSIWAVPLTIFALVSLFAKQQVTANKAQIRWQYMIGIFPFYHHKVSINRLQNISIEEMSFTREASFRRARYMLYIEQNHKEIMIMRNMPEEMAIYVRQVLSEFYSQRETSHSSRLQGNIIDKFKNDSIVRNPLNQKQNIK